MKKATHLLTFLSLSFLVLNCGKEDITRNSGQSSTITVADASGNVYNTVQIGNQVWMSENLKTTKYNDGTDIVEYTAGNDWHNANESKAFYQWPNTDDLNNAYADELPYDFYGALYNHYAIETGKLAPTGWRVATVADYQALEAYVAANNYLGQEAIALKSTVGWLAPSNNGLNAFDFNGLPNGYTSAFGTPTASEIICTWATTNVDMTSGIRTMINLHDQDSIIYSANPIQIGAAVRCIRE